MILNPNEKYIKVQEAFKKSYAANKKLNKFTKVKMDFDADALLQNYFSNNLSIIESWFNIISPRGRDIIELKNEFFELRSKNWKKILL